MTGSMIKVVACKLLFILATILVVMYTPAKADDTLSVEQLIERFDLREAETATKDHPLYKQPEKVVVWNRPIVVNALKKQFPDINFVTVDSVDAIAEEIIDADVFIGFCAAPLRTVETQLRYIQSMAVGVEGCAGSIILKDRGVLVSNVQKMSGPQIAEHAIAMMMSLVRGLDQFHNAQREKNWDRRLMSTGTGIWEIDGRTILIAGLGGIGKEVAQRANGLGMTVLATRNSSKTGPDYVDYVGLSDELNELAKRADVVVNTVPLTEKTRGMFDKAFFDAMPAHSYYISVGRGATTDQDALIEALQSGSIAGAGLDVTDPEPLPADSALWTIPRVIISPHIAARSDKYQQRVTTLVVANLQRYLEGKPILNLVDLERGY